MMLTLWMFVQVQHSRHPEEESIRRNRDAARTTGRWRCIASRSSMTVYWRGSKRSKVQLRNWHFLENLEILKGQKFARKKCLERIWKLFSLKSQKNSKTEMKLRFYFFAVLSSKFSTFQIHRFFRLTSRIFKTHFLFLLSLQESPSIPAVSGAPPSPSVRPGPSGAPWRSQTVRLAVLMAELEKSFGGESNAEKEQRALEHQIQHLGTILKVTEHQHRMIRTRTGPEVLFPPAEWPLPAPELCIRGNAGRRGSPGQLRLPVQRLQRRWRHFLFGQHEAKRQRVSLQTDII